MKPFGPVLAPRGLSSCSYLGERDNDGGKLCVCKEATMERRQNVGAAKSGKQDAIYDQLAGMNMNELEQTARDMGVPSPSELRKEELIAAIKQRM